jgi:hypothetical protein
MVFMSPSIAASNAQQAAATIKVIASNARVHDLASALDRAIPEGNALADPGVQAALHDAILSVFSDLGAARASRAVPPDSSSAAPSRAPGVGYAELGPSRPSGPARLVDAQYTCDGPYVVTPTYDNTSASIAATSSGCAASLGLNGPASSSLGVSIETVTWVYEIAQLDSSDFSSASAASASTAAGCGTYKRAGSASTSGDGAYLAREVLLPPPSVFDWMTKPVGTAIASAASQLFSAGGQGGATPLQHDGVYIYRAFSGGGQEIGPSKLNQLWYDNSCLTAPTASGGAPNGLADSRAATALNLFITALGAISPILDFTSIADHKCASDAFTSAIQAIDKQVTTVGNTSGDYWPTLLGETTPSLFSDLLGCAAETGTEDWLTELWQLEEHTIAAALLPANLAVAALDLDNLAEYTHAAESGFFVVGSPFGSPSAVPTRSPTRHGPVIETVAGSATAGYAGDGGPATGAEVGPLNDVALDRDGNLFLLDYQSCVVREVDGSTRVIRTVAGNGTCGYAGDDAPAVQAELDPRTNGFPEGGGLAVDSAGDLLIADGANNRVREVKASTGIIATIAGGAPQVCAAHTNAVGDGCPAAQASLFYPHGVAIDAPRNLLYIADGNYNSVRKVDLTTTVIGTVAGPDCNFFCGGYNGDNQPAAKALLNFPTDVAVDSAGNVYIVDNLNCRIREVSASTGLISTVVGNGMCGYAGDGGQATAAAINIQSCLGCPESGRVRADATGDLFIADTFNNVVREVDATTHLITTIAGDGVAGYAGDGGPATCAKLNKPTGIAIDANGDVYIADGSNDRVRVVHGVANKPPNTAAHPAGSATTCGVPAPEPAAPTPDPSATLPAPTVRTTDTMASLSDDFTNDAALNSDLWLTDTPLLVSLARITGNACCPSYVTPELGFSAAGMTMSGVSGDLQVAGVQSTAALTPPFAVHATVQATEGSGNPIVLELINASLSQYVGFFGHIGGAGANNFGLEESTTNPFSGASGLPVVDSASLNTAYVLTIAVDAGGNTTASVSDAAGNVLGSTPGLPLGTGPFFVVLGQFEGEPPRSGPNATVWSKVTTQAGVGSTP